MRACHACVMCMSCAQELEQLRAAAQALKQDVDLLRANQESQREQEEALLLGQLKKTVHALQAESSAISDQQQAVRRSLPSVHLQQHGASGPACCGATDKQLSRSLCNALHCVALSTLAATVMHILMLRMRVQAPALSDERLLCGMLDCSVSCMSAGTADLLNRAPTAYPQGAWLACIHQGSGWRAIHKLCAGGDGF